jgi:hypothetical protein
MTWAQEGWAKGISSIGGHDHLDIGCLVKTIHLIEQLNEHSLHLTIGTCLRIKLSI